MPIDNSGGSSIGASFGSAISKALKPKSAGSSVGRAVSRASRSSRTRSRSSGGGTRYSIPENRGGGKSRGGGGRPEMSIPENHYNTPKTGIPDINAFLGTDAAYQNVVRGGKRSLADFLSELGRRRGEAGTQFTQTKASMERDRVQQLEDLRNEFASRGLIQSGLFGEEQGKFQQQFTQQSQALQQQQAALLADLMSQEKNYRREQDLALEAAKQEALARRAAKFKIGA